MQPSGGTKRKKAAAQSSLSLAVLNPKGAELLYVWESHIVKVNSIHEPMPASLSA